MQTHYKFTANSLQTHCKLPANSLQTHCKLTANSLQTHCKLTQLTPITSSNSPVTQMVLQLNRSVFNLLFSAVFVPCFMSQTCMLSLTIKPAISTLVSLTIRNVLEQNDVTLKRFCLVFIICFQSLILINAFIDSCITLLF